MSADGSVSCVARRIARQRVRTLMPPRVGPEEGVTVEMNGSPRSGATRDAARAGSSNHCDVASTTETLSALACCGKRQSTCEREPTGHAALTHGHHCSHRVIVHGGGGE